MPFLILAFKFDVASFGSAADKPTISARQKKKLKSHFHSKHTKINHGTSILMLINSL